MTENVTIYRSVNDPVVSKEYRCRSCMSSMGDFRLYEGSSPNKRHLRGRLVQTCENGACHRTVYHSSDAYLYDDGQNLIVRLNARENQREHLLDDTVKTAPLRVQPPPPPAPTQSGPCPGNCRYASGGKPPGSRQCIEIKCKACCSKARANAEATHTIRDRCKIHSVSSFTPLTSPSQQPQPPTVPSLTAVPGVTFPSSQEARQPQAGPSRLPLAQTPQRRPVAPIVQRTPETPTRTQSSSSVPVIQNQISIPPVQASQKNRLADPISATWKHARDQAAQKTAVVQGVISRRSEIREEDKKTVSLWIWYKPKALVTRLPVVVDTYPDLRLNSIPLLVREYQLDNNSLFDYWNGTVFDTITPSSIISVDKGRPVLLRHRPSLINCLDYDDCPGLKDAVLAQSKAATRKRLAEDELVSPLKKVVKERAGVSLHESDNSAIRPPTHQERSNSHHTEPRPVLRSPPQPLIRDPLDMPEPNPECIKQISIARWVSGWETIFQAVDDDCDATDSEASEYPKVFGLPYVKSTVCDYKKKLKASPQELISQFVQYGDVRRGSWQRFTRAKYRHDRATKQPEGSTAVAATVVPALEELQIPNSPPPPTRAQIKQEATPAPDRGDAASDLVVLAPEPSTSRIPLRLPQQLRLPSPIQEDTPEDIALNAAFEKHRPVYERVMASLAEDLDQEDGESDPAKLCPFCDDVLPESPSASLLELRTRLEDLSQPDPTPQNPSHRRCPGGFAQHIDFCSHHRVEKEDKPIALQEGWPLMPDFSTLYDRVCRNYLFIAKISESSSNKFLQAAKDYYSEGVGNHQQSMLGQYQSLRFMNSGAGYYGNPGSQIIQTAVRHLVPQTSINLLDIHPVKYNDFIQDVLLPEATVRLIENDLNVSYSDAIAIFEKSCRFGNHIHPADSPEYEPHIRTALRRASTEQYHGYDTYREWIASELPLDIKTWIKEDRTGPLTEEIPAQTAEKLDKGKHPMVRLDHPPGPQLTAEELYMKQEEEDEYLNDPFANMDEEEDDTAVGSVENPIVID